MNRREAVGVLVLIVVAVAAGLIDRDTSHATTPAPAATTATAAAGYWQQQYDDAQVELEASSTALQAAPLTGQPVDRLTRQYCAAIQAHDLAAAHLRLDLIGPTKTCPTEGTQP